MQNALSDKEWLPLLKLQDEFHYVPYVSVMSTDREVFRFLVDSGASFSYVFTNAKRGEHKIRFPGATLPLGQLITLDFEFGKVEFYEVGKKYFWISEMGLHGILGMNFLEKRFLDLSAGRLYL